MVLTHPASLMRVYLAPPPSRATSHESLVQNPKRGSLSSHTRSSQVTVSTKTGLPSGRVPHTGPVRQEQGPTAQSGQHGQRGLCTGQFSLEGGTEVSGVTNMLAWEEHNSGLPEGHAEGLCLCLPAGFQPWLLPPNPWERDMSIEPLRL